MNDYGDMFYGTLPPDTQDFRQVISGVGRSLREMGRSTQYLPYDVLGAPVDLATMAMRPFGYQTQTPVGGSDWLIELARQYGLADKPTGSGIETATRFATGITSPTAVPRAVGRFAQGLERVSDITTEQANRAADALVRQITGNPAATAPQVIQETSMPFMQAIAPKMPGLLETPVKPDLGFYSALEQATIPLQNKGTGAQFLAQIEKTAGVKPEEIKWTGLDDFLRSRQNVTKQEVQDYLAANRVNLQEVQLGQGTVKSFEQWAADQGFGPEAIRDFGPTLRNSYEAFKENASQKVGAAKFSQYTLPGGENYREILLTLPERTAPFDPSNVKIYRNRLSATQGTYTIKYGDNAVGPFADDIRIENNYSGLSDAEIMDVAKRMYEKGNELSGIKPMSGAFKSSHFDQPNILAHMRVNDRVVDGKKTLFIEEIQSDWHQAGRKKGYKGNLEEQNKEIAEIKSKFGDLEGGIFSEFNPDKNTFDVYDSFAGYKGTFANEQEANRFVDEANAAYNRLLELQKNQRYAVPDAPFKTSWHELSLKRAIQEASEKGYDQIAFTTGKTQAERYDLSKQIDEINVVGRIHAGTGELTKSVALDTVDGQSIRLGVSANGLVDNVNKPEMIGLVGKNLDEVVGKELAKKIMEGGSQTISGEGLKVGGEGMKGFYDQILPKSLEKLGKKFDAKVGKTDMDGVEVWSMDITPKMRESVLTKGQPLFAATPAIPAVGLLGDEGE